MRLVESLCIKLEVANHGKTNEKTFLLAVFLNAYVFFTPQSIAQTGNFVASSGPASMGVLISSYSQFNLSYDGYLYECFHPRYEIREITAHLIFHKNNETRVFIRKMGGTCTTPWNYTAPDLAQYGDFENTTRDPELWQKLREVLFGDADGVKPVFEVAFEYEGRWDSDYGRNFRMDLVRE